MTQVATGTTVLSMAMPLDVAAGAMLLLQHVVDWDAVVRGQTRGLTCRSDAEALNGWLADVLVRNYPPVRDLERALDAVESGYV